MKWNIVLQEDSAICSWQTFMNLAKLIIYEG